MSNDYEIQGNYYMKDMHYIEIKLWKCINGTNINNVTCQDQSVIDAYIAQQTLSFAFVNSMFVPDDYVTPFHYYLDDRLFFNLDPNT